MLTKVLGGSRVQDLGRVDELLGLGDTDQAGQTLGATGTIDRMIEFSTIIG